MRTPSGDAIVAIQKLQFIDLYAAQEMTRDWLATNFGIHADSVVLRPSAVSLNSFNGIYAENGKRTFFKSHIEPGSTISEFYNAQILHDAGYATVLPLRIETEEGKQIAFYPVIDAPTVFDQVRGLETGGSRTIATAVLDAERAAAADILAIHHATTQRTSAAEHAAAPIHQLFWHRLTGGRFRDYYAAAALRLPDGRAIPMPAVGDLTWVINGVEQPRTLHELVVEATAVLDPAQPALTVVGHGDAHFGNVFLEEGRFRYFDPAFAGRHSALLDVVKPLFHNVFANWMYFPGEAAAEVHISASLSGDTITVDYGPHLSRYRQELLTVKQAGLINPLLQRLADADALPHGRRPLDLALMCCPLLTMNLCDASRFPVTTGLLGMALAVQMGNGDVAQELRTSPDQATVSAV